MSSGGNCPRGNCPRGVIVLGGSCPRGVVVLGGSFPGGNFPGGDCPGGNCPDTLSFSQFNTSNLPHQLFSFTKLKGLGSFNLDK